LGQSIQVQFGSDFGQVQTVADPNGVTVQHRYDGFGRQIEAQGPGGISISSYAVAAPFDGVLHSPSDFPRIEAATETHGTDGTVGGGSRQILDHSGRVVRSTNVGFGGVEVVSDQSFDRRGRLSSASLPHLATAPGAPPAPHTSYSYDFLDRVTQVRHPDGTTSERHYASGVSLAPEYQHWLTNLYCPATEITRCGVDVELSIDAHAPGETGNENVIIRDYDGLVVRSIDGENVDSAAASSNYYYGAFNNLRGTADNGDALSVFDYDAYGRLASHVDPDSGQSQYTYTAFGELKTSLDPRHQLRTSSYDMLGRREKIVDQDGDTRWIYDQGPGALGHLSESISPPTVQAVQGQHVRYEYEAPTSASSLNRGLVQRIIYDLDDASYAFNLHYDSLARIDTTDYPFRGAGNPVRAKYSYEPTSGALVSVSENATGVDRPIWKIDSALEGYLVTQQTFGNGAVSTFTYDPERRWLTSARTTLDTPVGNAIIQDLTYSHYENGQVFKRAAGDRTQEYTYDALGRLATQTNFGTGFPSAGLQSAFHYDVHGNLTQNNGVANVYSATHPHLPETVGPNSYFHDGNGNLASREGADIPGQVQTFTYTPFDLPRSIVAPSANPPSSVELDYTADGTRVVRREGDVSHHFASQLYERSFSASGTIEEHFRFAAGSELVAETLRNYTGATPSDKTLYFHSDSLGTPETISDSDANYQYQSYDAFGSRDPSGGVPSSELDPTRIGFTGQLQESASRLIDMGGRVYDPLAGRFTTADPIIRAPFFSQGLNRYAYVFNDPINATDPSGFSSVDSRDAYDTAGGVAAIAWIPAGAFIATRGLSGGVGALAGAANIADTFITGIGAPHPGSSGTVAAPSAAPTSSTTLHTTSATNEKTLPGGSLGAVQERPANLSLFAPERGALAGDPADYLPNPVHDLPPEARKAMNRGYVQSGLFILGGAVGRVTGWALARLGFAAEGTLNSVPLLARASGREMLGEALNVLKATPAGERGALASELMAQVQARAVGGAWQATEMAGANGARAFVGEYHTLVVDAAGNVFKGANAGVTFGVVNGAPGVASWSGLAQVF
jgi:RHS repeat-associated protein